MVQVAGRAAIQVGHREQQQQQQRCQQQQQISTLAHVADAVAHLSQGSVHGTVLCLVFPCAGTLLAPRAHPDSILVPTPCHTG